MSTEQQIRAITEEPHQDLDLVREGLKKILRVQHSGRAGEAAMLMEDLIEIMEPATSERHEALP